MTLARFYLYLTLLLAGSSCRLEHFCEDDSQCWFPGDTCRPGGADGVKRCYQGDSSDGGTPANGCAPVEKGVTRSCDPIPQVLLSMVSVAGGKFGTSVAASGGNRILAGSPGASGGQTGEAEVFSFDQSKWASTDRLASHVMPALKPGVDFGKGVALRLDAALVNADDAVYYFPFASSWGMAEALPRLAADSMGLFTKAAVLVGPKAGTKGFAGCENTGTKLQKIYTVPSAMGGTSCVPFSFPDKVPDVVDGRPVNTNYIGFGDALAANDSWLLIGASGTDAGQGFGSLFAYNYSAAGCPKIVTVDTQAKNGDATKRALLGKSVAVSGNCAVVGAPPYTGATASMIPPFFVYGFDGSQWARDTTLESPLASPSAADQPGAAIAMDGDLIAVGSPGADNGRGAVTVFQWRGKTSKWQQVATFLGKPDADFATSQFGAAVAVSGDLVVVGASGATSNGMTNAGAVLVYSCPAS